MFGGELRKQNAHVAKIRRVKPPELRPLTAIRTLAWAREKRRARGGRAHHRQRWRQQGGRPGRNGREPQKQVWLQGPGWTGGGGGSSAGDFLTPEALREVEKHAKRKKEKKRKDDGAPKKEKKRKKER